MIEIFTATTGIDQKDNFSVLELTEIADLPIDLIKTYDTDTLLNLVLNYRKIRFSEVSSECIDRLGLNSVFYQGALAWSLEMQGQPTIEGLLSQYSVIESVLKGGLDKINLSHIVANNIKPNHGVSDEMIASYSIMPLMSESFGNSNNGSDAESWWGRKVGEDKIIQINLDKPIGFSLNYDNIPQAVSSVGASSSNELMLYQIQGIKPKPVHGRTIKNSEKRIYSTWGLEPINWKESLIQVAENIASNLNFKSIAIQSAANNYWVNKLDKNNNICMRFEAAQKVYDTPAISLGFNLGEDGNWHKQLP